MDEIEPLSDGARTDGIAEVDGSIPFESVLLSGDVPVPSRVAKPRDSPHRAFLARVSDVLGRTVAGFVSGAHRFARWSVSTDDERGFRCYVQEDDAQQGVQRRAMLALVK